MAVQARKFHSGEIKMAPWKNPLVSQQHGGLKPDLRWSIWSLRSIENLEGRLFSGRYCPFVVCMYAEAGQ